MIHQQLEIPCPSCGKVGWPSFDLPTPGTLVTLALCQACATQFAVEIQITLAIEVSTCRLTLPSTQRPDALAELETLPEPEDQLPY